jgi:mannose/fructose/N-acetylgalactosamine-specific phosphotransferase system component IID
MPLTNSATSGSAYSVFALSLPMPRRVIVMTPWSPSVVAWKLGTRWTTSAIVCTCALSSSAALIGVTASGVLCSVVVRLVAVTVTSCNAVSDTAALAAVAGGRAVCAWAAAVPASMARTARWMGDASEARDF